MKPLLEIRNIPISIEYKTSKAHYEIVNTLASVEITHSKSGLEMQMKPIRLNFDTIEASNSIGITSVIKSVGDFSKKGLKATYDATASYAEEGNMMLNISVMGRPITEIALNKFNSDVSFNLGLNQTVGNEISWEPTELKIKYELDKFNLDWKINRPEFKFIPGNIEFIIKEYPRLEINYVGKPIYVPPSGDPDYKPIDTFA